MTSRLAQLKKNMPEGMDALLVTSPVNRRYYTGFPSSAGTLIVTAEESLFVIDSRYFEAAGIAVKGCEVILQEEKPVPQIKRLLSGRKIKRLGVESRTVTVSTLRAWEKAFTGVELVTDDSVSDLIERQRSVKSPEEIDRIREAQRIADKGFLHILNFIQTGRTEREIAVELEEYTRRQGSDGPAFEYVIAAGINSSRPHAVPSDYGIRTGNFVTMDFGCTVGGYRSDMTRTVAVGSVNPRQRELYETVLSAQLKAIGKIKGGASCKGVDKAARDIIDASEFKGLFGHGLGHCVGLEIHEPPHCSGLSKHKLEPGMVTSVEPGIYDPGKYGVRIEDIVVVTKSGCENLCTAPKELIIL